MSIKTRKCIGCDNLTDEPGELLCHRCRDLIKKEPPPKRYKILVVDDDMAFSTGLKQKLEATLHFEVATAYDGRKGYEKIAYEAPELLVVDVEMPVLNGKDFMEKLRADEREAVRRLPVIVVSEKKQMERYFHPWDIQGFFVKPINVNELVARVKELLESGPSA
ncbi:MAG: response regulator transcription factor [Candidatus Omnitrophota bacterium]